MASIQKRISKITGKTTWRFDYLDATGTRRAKSFKAKKQADAWRARVEHVLLIEIHAP
jgi:hypothetical protein